MIHQQDIRRPLALPRSIPAERLLPALWTALFAPVVWGVLRVRDVALSTSAPLATVRALLEGITERFATVVTSEECSAGKPHPEIHLRACAARVSLQSVPSPSRRAGGRDLGRRGRMHRVGYSAGDAERSSCCRRRRPRPPVAAAGRPLFRSTADRGGGLFQALMLAPPGSGSRADRLGGPIPLAQRWAVRRPCTA
jgi:hypothetical protein